MKDEFGWRVTVMVIPNASHALIPEQPKAVVEALVRWIKSLALRSVTARAATPRG
jgi:phage baseplate assembly protein W